MYRYLFLILVTLMSSHAGVITTFSKERVKKLYSKLKAEGKAAQVTKVKTKRNVFIAYDVSSKKVLKVFLSLKNAKEYASLQSKQTKVSQTSALVFKYTINYSEEDTPEFSEDEREVTIDSSFDLLPMRMKFITGRNISSKEYDLNYFTLSSGFEYMRGNLTAHGNLFLQSYDIQNETDDDRVFFKELYLKYAPRSFQVVVGPQIRVWGVFDELSELDVLTLKNTSRALFDDGTDLRRPMNLIYISKYIGDSKLEIALNMGNEKGYFSDINERFYGINKAEGTIRGGDLPAAFSSLVPMLGVQNKERASTGFAGRWSFTYSSSDFQFVFGKLLSDLPGIIVSENLLAQAKTMSITAESLSKGLSMEYQELTVFGGSFVRQIGNFVFKLELSYKDGLTYLTQDLDNILLAKIGSNIGGEYELDAINSTLRFQINSSLIQTSEELTVDKESHLFAGEYVMPFLGEKLNVGLRFSYELEDAGYMLSPRLNYELTDNSAIELRSFHFGGDEQSDLGFHSNDNFVELEYKLVF